MISEAQWRAWKTLPPVTRYLLTSHRPDCIEEDANLRSSIMTALENVYGPREWTPRAALVEEGEDDGNETRWPKGGGYAMTYAEIGEEIGVCGHQVKQIVDKALRKLRHPSRAGSLRGYLDGSSPLVPTSAEEIDAAIERATGDHP